MDATMLNRLRWRCRRGMLENDLILTRFLDARGDAITDQEVAALDVLLELSDNELWDLLSGRARARRRRGCTAARALESHLRKRGMHAVACIPIMIAAWSNTP